MAGFKLALLRALRENIELAQALPGGIHSRRVIMPLVSTGADRNLLPAALLEINSAELSETLDAGPLSEMEGEATLTFSTLLSQNALRSNSRQEREKEAAREEALDTAAEAARAALYPFPELAGWRIERLFFSGLDESEASDLAGEESSDLFEVQASLRFGFRAVRQ